MLSIMSNQNEELEVSACKNKNIFLSGLWSLHNHCVYSLYAALGAKGLDCEFLPFYNFRYLSSRCEPLYHY